MDPFPLSDEQTALADTVARWASGVEKRSPGEPIAFSRSLWRELADLGVLALGTAEGGGGALEIALSLGELGRVAMAGPLIPAVVAGQALPPDEYAPVITGEATVGLGSPGQPVAWGGDADRYLLVEGDAIALARPDGQLVPRRSLGDDLWAAGALVPSGPAFDGQHALAVGDIAISSYLWGAATEAVRRAADYARDRQQFGRAIGDFQALAFPLAEAQSRLHAVRALTLMAARGLDVRPAATALAVAARRAATAAAGEACRAAHQAFGGMGYTTEGPMAILSRRVQDVALCLPSSRRLTEPLVEAIATVTDAHQEQLG